MKILYIVSTLGRTGPSRQLYNLIKYLDRERFSPSILTLSPEPEDSMLSQFQKLEVSICSLGLSRLKGFIFGPETLKHHILTHQPDVIHTQGIRADMLSANYLQEMKCVATLRNYPYHDYLMKFGKLQGTYMARRHVEVLRRVDCLVACSNTVSNLMQKKYGINCCAIQNGVDDILFSSPSAGERVQIRGKLGLPAKNRVFIFVGALIGRKNPIAAIRAFLMAEVRKKSTLLMIGDGPLRGECERVAGNNPCIRFVGWVHDVREYLRGADFFVSTSISEGLPNAVLEALSVGLPVCLSDIESHIEILNCDQTAGKLAPIGSIEKFANAIEALSKINYAHASRAAVSIVHNHLSAQKMSEKYQDVYKKLTQARAISCIGK